MDPKGLATLKVIIVLVGAVALAIALRSPPPEPGSPEALALAEKQAERERQEAAEKAAEQRREEEASRAEEERLAQARKAHADCRARLKEVKGTEILKRVSSYPDSAEAWIVDLGWAVLNYDQKVALMRLVDCAERAPETDPSDYVVFVRSWSTGKALGSYIDGSVDIE